MKTKLFIFLFFYTSVFQSNLIAEEIPIIVISAGKTVQSIDKVGSSIEVINSDEIENSPHTMIGEIINNNSVSTNFFQTGGSGGNTAIQLRGLEKRYSTVYLDGVKMMDPSSPDGSFYLDNLTKNGIEKIEILKGTQSSLYGSNAIGGTINIFTKKGESGNHSSIEVETGSQNKKNINYSLHGANKDFNYFIGLNKYLTDGISTMTDNSEEDNYRNDNIVTNFGYNINENITLQNSLRVSDTFYEYDTVLKSRTDEGVNTDNLEFSNSLKLIYQKDKFKNSLSYNKLHIERYTTDYAGTKQNYFGKRDAVNYLSEYNFNLDNKLLVGIDSEFDSARYRKDFSTPNTKHDESIISQYFDLQFRPGEKIYSSFGVRSDDHTTAGRKTSGRGTLAYKLNGNTKIRSSLGAGVRFPAMYDYAYGFSTIVSKNGSLEELQSERGLSFDLGYDTSFSDMGLDLSATYFKTKQKNSLRSTGKTDWVMRNTTGVNTSEGIEFEGNWKPINKKFSLGFGYTFTDSYDANTCEQDELDSYSDNECRNRGKLATAKVRVPRHFLQTNFNWNVSKYFSSSLNTKFSSRVRDFGNDNDKWTDQTLKSYIIFDLSNSYHLSDDYKMQFNIKNIFNEKYQQAWEYSAPGRSLNVGIKRVY
jgi:vitamin B12 transporter